MEDETKNKTIHIPVLLKEMIFYLDPRPGDVILDTTVGGGGHTKAILRAIGKNGRLIGIDQDSNVLDKTRRELDQAYDNVTLLNGNFKNLDELLKSIDVKEVDGIIFDLGINSAQLEESGRGFSFMRDEPLLMNFKADLKPSDLTAKDIINNWSEYDIADVLYRYGEERYSRKIAKTIVEHRKRGSIKTTFELVDLIRQSVPPAYRNSRRLNCCTRTFQALRIAVNDELSVIEEGLEKGWRILSSEARMVVISFHSLEDRIVKRFFRAKKENEMCEILTKKPIKPSREEVVANPRSRSSKLRAAKKINID